MNSIIGVLIGLFLAIYLIIKKIPIAYSLMLGALVGGVLGGYSLAKSVEIMVEGVKDITPAIIRILTAGVLSGVLIKTGAANSISNAIIGKLGIKYAYLALGISAMLLCAIGVFIDVTIITLAPIALQISRRNGLPMSTLLLVMIGGGKCGNIISPNPNTLIAAENYGADLSATMYSNLPAAIVGLAFTVFLLPRIFNAVKIVVPTSSKTFVDGPINTSGLPTFTQSIIGPLLTILLLTLRPICGIVIDPLIALPVGGLVGIVCMRRTKLLLDSVSYGLSKMSSVAILLVGTGTIAGIIKYSSLKDLIINLLSDSSFGVVFIAPIAGILMSAATASTTSGATIASSSFAETVLDAGVSPVGGAAMTNAGSTVLDHLPHGSFFHATGGAMEMTFKERLRLIPYESLVGLVLTLSSIGSYELFKLLA